MKVFMSGPIKAVENDPFELLGKEDTALVRQVPSVEDHRALMVVPTGWEAVAQRQVAMALAIQPKLRVGFIVETSPLKAALMATCMAQQPTCTMALQAWHYLDKNCHLWLWSKRVGKIQEPNAPMHLVVSSWFSSRGCYVQPGEGGQFVKVGASSALLPWKNVDSATETSWTAVTEKTPKVVESDVATSRHGRVRTLPSRCVDARQRYGDPSTRELLFVPAELGSAAWANLPTWKCHGCGENRIGETCVFCNVLPNPMTVQDTVGMVEGSFPPSPSEGQIVLGTRAAPRTGVSAVAEAEGPTSKGRPKFIAQSVTQPAGEGSVQGVSAQVLSAGSGGHQFDQNRQIGDEGSPRFDIAAPPDQDLTTMRRDLDNRARADAEQIQAGATFGQEGEPGYLAGDSGVPSAQRSRVDYQDREIPDSGADMNIPGSTQEPRERGTAEPSHASIPNSESDVVVQRSRSMPSRVVGANPQEHHQNSAESPTRKAVQNAESVAARRMKPIDVQGR